MSEQRDLSKRDRGMTLPELLISVVITGLLVTSIAVASSVVLRQTDNSEGRLNNARSEQNVNIWMPSDLTSAESVQTEANLLPCGDTDPATPPSFSDCPTGVNLDNASNAMLLTWYGSTIDPITNDAVDTVTMVSYRYALSGTEWVLERVECNATELAKNTDNFGPWTCEFSIALHDLPAPPDYLVNGFEPGVTVPEWVIRVTSALAATDDLAESSEVGPDDPTYSAKNAQRVLVTINGGGDADGAGGGEKTFSFSAGGTNREVALSTDDLTGAPNFTNARTKCGGNYGLIIDVSGSIPDLAQVKTGITNFIDAFAGKPVKLQIVTFGTLADTVDDPAVSTDDWTSYWDMLDTSAGGDVERLKGLVAAINYAGATNWEDGWFRMVRNQTGTVNASRPGTVVFFTDGIPTTNRIYSRSDTAGASQAPVDAGLSPATGGRMDTEGANRTSRVVYDSGVSNVIGVFVGSSTAETSSWEGTPITTNPPPTKVWERSSANQYQQGSAAYSYGNGVVFERGYQPVAVRAASGVAYERGFNWLHQRATTGVTYQQQVTIYERANGVSYQRRTDSRLYFERWTGSSWSTKTSAGATITWSTYLANNTVAGDSDGWRTGLNNGGSPTWGSISEADYMESNVSAGSSDGFQTVTSGSGWTWTSVPVATYNGSNTTTDSTDGWRTNTSWATVDWNTYNAGNLVFDATDGWRVSVSGTPGGWQTITSTEFNESDTGDNSGADGFQKSKVYTAPFTDWESSTWTAFAAGNTNNTESDGWRSRVTGTLGTWTAMSATEYSKANSAADNSDGFHDRNYVAPYSAWETATWSTYDAGNVNNTESDGWRARVTGPSTTWTTISSTQYAKSNVGNDDTDGFRFTYASWSNISWSTYSTNNVSPGEADGFRQVLPVSFPSPVPGGSYSWSGVTEQQYNASNSSDGARDGWRIAYTEKNVDVLSELVDPTGGVHQTTYDNSNGYLNVTKNDKLFVEPNWNYFGEAMKRIALAQCGGTVTIQTKKEVGGAAPSDPFVYVHDNTIATTSAAYNGATFDIPLELGQNRTIQIATQNLTSLDAWRFVGWSCKSGGQALTAAEMQTGDSNSDGWQELTINMKPNMAVSCVQTVKPKPTS